jgi:hypothetical protein
MPNFWVLGRRKLGEKGGRRMIFIAMLITAFKTEVDGSFPSSSVGMPR